MASRCIEALNELDQISEKIFYKHSKSRLKAEVEAKLRASKNRTDRLCTLSSAGSRNSPRLISQSSATSTQNSKRKTKSAIDTSKNVKTEQVRAMFTKSCPNYLNSRKKNSRTAASSSRKDAESENFGARSPSVFGRYAPWQDRYEPKAWFNLKDGADMGTIDSFACDHNNERALCYTVDPKQGRPVPQLLRHRLEVRIGQNGIVREKTGNADSENLSSEKEMEGSTIGANVEKVRPAPLSWEEQLNWRNANVVSPKPPPSQKPENKGLCETTPVIFNPREKKMPKDVTDSENTPQAHAYRMSVETRCLSSDRGNLTCAEKYVTSVQLEDAREEVAMAAKRARDKSAEVPDDDQMDMSTTISNIEMLYSRASASSESELSLNKEVGNPSDKAEHAQQGKQPQTRRELDAEKLSRVSKKVSFEDQKKNAKLGKQGSSSGKEKQKPNGEALSEKEPNDNEIRSSVEAERCTKPRPKSSHDRLETQRKSEIVEFIKEQRSQHSRPFTAPPSSPRTPLDRDYFSMFDGNLRSPIRVPTSEKELPSCASDAEPIDTTEPEDSIAHMPTQCSQEPEIKASENENPTADNGPVKPRVTVACKSAPTLRVTSQAQDRLARSKSSRSANRRTASYTPAKPVAVYSDSSMELPKNLPPAQALIELRKKIREDLAQETADLQLDIQQLYLKQHNDDRI